MNDIQRLLPQSPDAEKGLLSSMMLNPDIVAQVAGYGITDDHFHIPAHAHIFRAVLLMSAERKPLDIITLTQVMRDAETLACAGGVAAVSSLQTFLPTEANWEYYAEVMKEKLTLRRAIKTGNDHIARCYDEQDQVPDILASFQQELSNICTGHQPRKQAKSIHEMMQDKIDRMQSQEADEDILFTGIDRLDENSPLRLGDMPLIVGERKAGKSILSLTVTANMTTRYRILYFSLEDPETKIIDRLFAGASRIPMLRHHTSKLTVGETNAALDAIASLSARKLTIRDDIYDLDNIVAEAKQHKAAYPDLCAIVVDYAQLVRVKAKKNDTREREVAQISRTLRLLGMELKVAMILLSQLNKDGESRESRALEQDATACWKLENIEVKGEIDTKRRMLAIPWQRNGESGIAFPVTFLGHIARIENHLEDKNEK